MIAAVARDRTDPLSRLAALERHHDGPPSEGARCVALAGSSERHAWLQAAAETAFFRAMVKGQIGTIRRRREEGSFYPALLSDLALYRRQWRAWRRILTAYAAAAATY
jgi:hypothetical protein